MVTYLYEVAAFMLEIPEDEDEKEVERDHYNWQLVAPFNTLITVLIEAIGLVAGELAKNAAIGELKRECFTMDIALLLSLLTRYSLVLNDHCEISEDVSLQPPQPSVDGLLGMPADATPASASAVDLLGMPADTPASAADLLGMPAQASVDDLLGMPAPQASQTPQLSVDDLLGGVAPAVPAMPAMPAMPMMTPAMPVMPMGSAMPAMPMMTSTMPMTTTAAIQPMEQMPMMRPGVIGYSQESLQQSWQQQNPMQNLRR